MPVSSLSARVPVDRLRTVTSRDLGAALASAPLSQAAGPGGSGGLSQGDATDRARRACAWLECRRWRFNDTVTYLPVANPSASSSSASPSSSSSSSSSSTPGAASLAAATGAGGWATSAAAVTYESPLLSALESEDGHAEVEESRVELDAAVPTVMQLERSLHRPHSRLHRRPANPVTATSSSESVGAAGVKRELGATGATGSDNEESPPPAPATPASAPAPTIFNLSKVAYDTTTKRARGAPSSLPALLASGGASSAEVAGDSTLGAWTAEDGENEGLWRQRQQQWQEANAGGAGGALSLDMTGLLRSDMFMASLLPASVNDESWTKKKRAVERSHYFAAWIDFCRKEKKLSRPSAESGHGRGKSSSSAAAAAAAALAASGHSATLPSGDSPSHLSDPGGVLSFSAGDPASGGAGPRVVQRKLPSGPVTSAGVFVRKKAGRPSHAATTAAAAAAAAAATAEAQGGDDAGDADGGGGAGRDPSSTPRDIHASLQLLGLASASASAVATSSSSSSSSSSKPATAARSSGGSGGSGGGMQGMSYTFRRLSLSCDRHCFYSSLTSNVIYHPHVSF